MNDIHELRAENERLVAEVERLRGQLLKATPALTRIAMLREERDAARAENARQSKIRSRLTTLDAANLKSEIRRAEAAEAKVAKVEALVEAVRALRSRVHASKERGAAYDAWVLTDLLDSALEGHTCTDPNAECWTCAVLADASTEQRAEHPAPPLRPDPDLIDNVEGDTKAVERTQARARDILAEGDGRG